MKEIELLIPNYHLLKQDIKDKTGQTLSYFKIFIEDCPISHYVTSVHFDNLFKFDCLSFAKSNNPSVSRDVKDFECPNSMNYWYKQMDDKCEMNYIYEERPERSIDPLEYFLHNPKTQEVPETH